MTCRIAACHEENGARASPAPDELDKPARPPDPGNRERHGRHAGHAPAGRGRSRLAEIGSFGRPAPAADGDADGRSEEHTSELQSLMRILYAGLWLQKKKTTMNTVNM